MKLKSSMWFVVPVIVIFMVLCLLVAIFTIQNSQVVTLRYNIPFFQVPATETNVVYVILFSIMIGIAVMIFFVTLAGIGWRYYALASRGRERKERKWLWDKRENAIADSLKGYHQDAIKSFEKIIDKEKPHVELYVGLAEAFERQGDPQKAIENYNVILAKDPKNMRALFGTARNWEALGNYAEAITMYKRILDVDPASPTAFKKKQELLEKSGQYAEAIEAYQRVEMAVSAPETQETLASLHYRLAVQQLKSNDKKNAEFTLKKCQKDFNAYVPAMVVLSNLYMQDGHEREARRVLEQAAEQHLSTIIFRRLEDCYYDQKGDPKTNLKPVIDLYKKLIHEKDANHLRLALGKLYLKLEVFDEAERILLEFLSADHSIPQAHLLLADLYQRTGKTDKALEEYRFAAQLVDIKIADFKCYRCGAMYEFWADQCTSCKSWGTIEDIFFTKGPKSLLPELKQKPLPQLPTTTAEASPTETVVTAS